MKAKGLLAILTVIGMLAVAGCSSQANGSDDAGKSSAGRTVVKVGLSDDVSPPFLSFDDNNKPIGYDMDYLAELQKRLPEYEFKYELGEEESQLIGTDAGKYAFAMNWFFKNPEREKKFLYPEHPFGYSVTALITKSDRDDIKSFENMTDKKLAPMSPAGGLRSIIKMYNENHPDKQVKVETMDNPSNGENMKLVAAGKADALFLNVITFDDVNKKLNLDLKVGGVISKEPVWLVFNKNQTELAKKIDAATQDMVADGTLGKLAEKWFKVDLFKDIAAIEKGYQSGKQ